MIVAVKRNRKQKFIKLVSFTILILVIAGYFYHMNEIRSEKEKLEFEEKQALRLQEENKEKVKKEVEKAILTEIEKAVDLIGQEHVKHVKIMDNKVLLICEPDTNLDALIVRYGVMALVKKTLSEIIIAVDVNFILKSKLNEK